VCRFAVTISVQNKDTERHLPGSEFIEISLRPQKISRPTTLRKVAACASLNHGLNYLADTLIFWGTVLLLVDAIPRKTERRESLADQCSHGTRVELHTHQQAEIEEV
jgi:hypothetical protein